MPRPKAPCGTEAAYRRHLRNAEPMDAACRDAHARERRSTRRSPAASDPISQAPTQTDSNDGESDDFDLIVTTLRKAFVKIANDDPTKLAPISREFRAAVEAKRGPAEPPKELSLAEQLAEARATRAARAAGQGAPA